MYCFGRSSNERKKDSAPGEKAGKIKFTKSIGFSAGAVISVMLLVILGAKSAYDVYTFFSSSIGYNEEIELNKSKVFADEIERDLNVAYAYADSLAGSIQNTMKVVWPVSLIERTLDKFANYDLNITEELNESAKYVKNKDEVGAVIRALNKLNENLIGIVTNISLHSQNTAATSEELTATAQSTASSAHQVSQAVTNIAEGATSQAEYTQSAAGSVENSD